MTIEEKIRAAIAKFDPEVVETIVKVLVKTSVTGTVITLIHASTPTHTKTQKVKLFVGAAVLGNMAGEKAGVWAYEKFQSIVEAIKELLPEKHVTVNSKSE